MRRSIRTLLAGAALALSAPAASAQVTIDQFNDGAPLAGSLFGSDTFGWFYTPGQTFELTSILTQFASAADPTQVVDVEVFATDGGTTLLGAPMAAASFLASSAVGATGGATFLPGTTLNAGMTYFIGFSNVYGIGANLTTGTQFLEPVRYGDFANIGGTPYGTLAERSDIGADPTWFAPRLEIQGVVAASTVPEPATVALMATGLVGVAVAARRRRVTKA